MRCTSWRAWNANAQSVGELAAQAQPKTLALTHLIPAPRTEADELAYIDDVHASGSSVTPWSPATFLTSRRGPDKASSQRPGVTAVGSKRTGIDNHPLAHASPSPVRTVGMARPPSLDHPLRSMPTYLVRRPVSLVLRWPSRAWMLRFCVSLSWSDPTGAAWVDGGHPWSLCADRSDLDPMEDVVVLPYDRSCQVVVALRAEVPGDASEAPVTRGGRVPLG